MKLQILLNKILEQLQGANIALLLLMIFVGIIVITFTLWRWGSGCLVTLSFVFSGLLMTRSTTLNFMALTLRFVLVIILVFYAFLYRRNRVNFSKAMGVLLLLPLVMMIDSVRVSESLDAFFQGLTFLIFFIGLILGGQKIFGDERGRHAFVLSMVWFSIIMTGIQIPFISSMSSDSGLFSGVFETTVGFMIIGMPGVVFLVWQAMTKKVWSLAFMFYILFALLTFVLMVLTGGRTAIGGAVLGILVVLMRKLRRNIIIMLFACVILLPIGTWIIKSFSGFEEVRAKFSSIESSGRAELYARAWDEIMRKPLIGYGTGTSFVKAASITGTEYHQSFLQWAIEHGIPFAIVMLLLFLWLPIRGLLLMRDCVTEELKDTANLSSALLLGYVFSSFLSHALLTTTFILPAYSVIALQEGIRNENLQLLAEKLIYSEKIADNYNDWPA
jgi:hypothetical protein